MKAQFNFSEAEKDGMLKVLAKYPIAPSHHHEIAEMLKVDGSTVLSPGEALYLAGIVQPYYSFLAQRLRHHPAVIEFEDNERPARE